MAITNDDEQLEALRRWWAANGMALVIGVVLGLIAIGAWQYWQHRTRSQSLEASQLYGQLLNAVSADAAAKSEDLAGRLTSDYAGTPYAAQAQLAMAAYEVRHQQYDKAAKRLRWVADNASDQGLRWVARLREARVLWAQKKADSALALLDTDMPQGGFSALYYELKGDILVSEDKLAQARQAYELALSNAPQGMGNRARLQQKLNDIKLEAAAAS